MRRRAVAGGVAAAAAAALGVALWLALPGGGGPSRAEYLTRVSAACRAYARRLEHVPAPSEPVAYGNVASSVRQAVPLLEAQAGAMRAIPAPAALEPRLQRLFALDRRSVAALRLALAAALRRDAGGVALGLVRFAAVRDRVHRASLALGIRCEAN